jgi:sugar phosphate isomerase/epimerase
MSLPKVGCQLIIFGGHVDVENEIERVFDGLKAAGYDAAECGGEAQRVKKALDERGLVHAGQHIALSGNPNAQQIIEYARTVGSSDVSNSGLLRWGDDLTADDYAQAIEKLNELGRELRAAGIHLHYHNHAFEFEKVDGDKNGMDLLMEGLDPQACDLCVDVAWVAKGGENPAEYLRKHKDKIGYLHFKDFSGESWVPLGQGEMEFGPIIEEVKNMPRVRWVVCEQDNTKGDPFECVKQSRQYLKETFGY